MSENKASGGNAFSSLMGFLMTAIGFAVGVGSIWRFPYLLGTNGGALFLIVYVLIIVVIGIPLLTAETAMGFKTQKTADSKRRPSGRENLGVTGVRAQFCGRIRILQLRQGAGISSVFSVNKGRSPYNAEPCNGKRSEDHTGHANYF